MKKIKTIVVRRDNPGMFDNEVNAAIKDGWELVRRFIHTGMSSSTLNFYPVLVAYLEKQV